MTTESIKKPRKPATMTNEQKAAMSAKLSALANARHATRTADQKADIIKNHTRTCYLKREKHLREVLKDHPHGMSKTALYEGLRKNSPMICGYNCVNRAIKDGLLTETLGGVINFKWTGEAK